MSEPATDSLIATALRAMALLRQGERFAAQPLSGGISCDVWLIATGEGRKFVVKRALPKLRVAAEWRAPAERSHTEVEWLRLAAGIDPKLAPKVLGEYPAQHIFAMEYLPADTHPVWKTELAAGRANASFAAQTGSSLARLHAGTANREEVAKRFASHTQFFALRLEPYLLYTAEQHPSVAARIRDLARRVASARVALMQGDVSPKNILRGPDGPVFLDAETACYGDPAFDLAFCLNHLLLKCIWHPEHADAYLSCFDAFADAYLGRVTWTERSDMEARTAALFPALLLARIDGKSPVEYITAQSEKAFVRGFAKRMLVENASSLADLKGEWRAALYSR